LFFFTLSSARLCYFGITHVHLAFVRFS
jgi:hypothetical protein